MVDINSCGSSGVGDDRNGGTGKTIFRRWVLGEWRCYCGNGSGGGGVGEGGCVQAPISRGACRSFCLPFLSILRDIMTDVQAFFIAFLCASSYMFYSCRKVTAREREKKCAVRGARKARHSPSQKLCSNFFVVHTQLRTLCIPPLLCSVTFRVPSRRSLYLGDVKAGHGRPSQFLDISRIGSFCEISTYFSRSL